MIKHYEHTQVGYVIIVAIVASMAVIGILLPNIGFTPITIGVFVVLAAVLVLFPSLTVIIWEDELEIRFGPGLIRKRFRLSDVESCQSIKAPWYYGWGIRLTPRGLLFRVSGFHTIRIKLRTGKHYLIGTDVPQELEAAINQAINTN